MTGLAFGTWIDGPTVDRAGLAVTMRILGWHRDESVDAVEEKYGPGRWTISPSVRPCDGTGTAIGDVDWTGGWEWFGRYTPETMPKDAHPDPLRTGQAQPWTEAAVSEFLSDLHVLDTTE